jgi:hypothetical protein
MRSWVWPEGIESLGFFYLIFLSYCDMIDACECNWAISSVVERLLYTQDAVGSNPTSPIFKQNQQRIKLQQNYPIYQVWD